MGTAGTNSSWHHMYKDSAWIFIGGLNYDLTEGDVITVFSQYGEVVNINLVRDKATGKSKGFAFLCYEDQRSTNMAVDNLNGITLVGRIIRVDHVEEYKVPKIDYENMDEKQRKLLEEGCAPTPIALGNQVKSEVKTEIKEEKSRHSSKKERKFQDSHESRGEDSHRHRSRSRERKVSTHHHRRSVSKERNRPSSHEKSHQSRTTRQQTYGDNKRHRSRSRSRSRERQKEREKEREKVRHRERSSRK